MNIVVTILEPTLERAIDAIRALPPDHDMVEVRVDAFESRGDLSPLLQATQKPLILTNRGGDPVESDFGLIDVEVGKPVKHPDRTVLSHHDFEGMPDIKPLIASMLSRGCAYTKIAVTPRNLRENEVLLAALRPKLSLFGMGERGLYSRVLAPFFGSELAFVSVDDAHSAAPGQLSLEKALAIYGPRPVTKPTHIFAIVGKPPRQSLSPSIHNPLFRKHGVPAAYTIALVDAFDEVIDPFEQGRLAGMSVTAPYKEDAFRYARKIGAKIGANAAEAGSLNTLLRTKAGVMADNTDVDGFEALLRGAKGTRAAVVGAGGTSRAAVVALRRAGFEITIFNRTPREGTRPLSELASFDGDVIINTLPGEVEIDLPKAPRVIEAAYSRGGLALLHAQAIRQNALFLEAFS